jgi:hypothetical protein
MQKYNKTIAITLRFWTNDLKVEYPESGGNAGQKACWDSGMAILEANKEKGITSLEAVIQCYEDIIPAIKELFRKSGIIVVSTNRIPRILSHKRRSK